MSRWFVLVCALLIGAVAPARAWCEATCVAPVGEGQSHCPSPGPPDAATTLSAILIDECPVLESARPTVAVRLEPSATIVDTYVPAAIPRHYVTSSFALPHNATTVFERSIPLRI